MSDKPFPINFDPFTRPLGRIGAFAPGGYICNCTKCGAHFMGDKRAVECLSCVFDSLVAAQSAWQAERAEMVAALTEIADLVRRTPVGAGDGGTFVLTGREGVEAAQIAARALVGREGEP